MKVIDEMDRVLLEDNEELRRRQSHYASDANGCIRQAVYDWRREPVSDPDTATALIKMKMGDAAEGLIRDTLVALEAEGKIASWEEQVPKKVAIEGLKYPISCRIDFLVHHLDQTAEGIDAKSSFGRGIKEIQRRGMPKDDHLVQMFFYLTYIVPTMRLVYIGRDSAYRTEFGLALSEGAVLLNGDPLPPEVFDMERFIAKFREIERCVEAGELPERPYLVAIKDGEMKQYGFTHQKVQYKGDWQCSYCRYRSTCWAPELARYASGHNAEMFAGRSIGEEE